MIANKCFLIGLHLLVTYHVAKTFVILSANVEDVKRIAKEFSGPLTDEIVGLILKATKNQTFKTSSHEIKAQNHKYILNSPEKHKNKKILRDHDGSIQSANYEIKEKKVKDIPNHSNYISSKVHNFAKVKTEDQRTYNTPNIHDVMSLNNQITPPPVPRDSEKILNEPKKYDDNQIAPKVSIISSKTINEPSKYQNKHLNHITPPQISKFPSKILSKSKKYLNDDQNHIEPPEVPKKILKEEKKYGHFDRNRVVLRKIPKTLNKKVSNAKKNEVTSIEEDTIKKRDTSTKIIEFNLDSEEETNIHQYEPSSKKRKNHSKTMQTFDIINKEKTRTTLEAKVSIKKKTKRYKPVQKTVPTEETTHNDETTVDIELKKFENEVRSYLTSKLYPKTTSETPQTQNKQSTDSHFESNLKQIHIKNNSYKTQTKRNEITEGTTLKLVEKVNQLDQVAQNFMTTSRKKLTTRPTPAYPKKDYNEYKIPSSEYKLSYDPNQKANLEDYSQMYAGLFERNETDNESPENQLSEVIEKIIETRLNNKLDKTNEYSSRRQHISRRPTEVHNTQKMLTNSEEETISKIIKAMIDNRNIKELQSPRYAKKNTHEIEKRYTINAFNIQNLSPEEEMANVVYNMVDSGLRMPFEKPHMPASSLAEILKNKYYNNDKASSNEKKVSEMIEKIIEKKIQEFSQITTNTSDSKQFHAETRPNPYSKDKRWPNIRPSYKNARVQSTRQNESPPSRYETLTRSTEVEKIPKVDFLIPYAEYDRTSSTMTTKRTDESPFRKKQSTKRHHNQQTSKLPAQDTEIKISHGRQGPISIVIEDKESDEIKRPLPQALLLQKPQIPHRTEPQIIVVDNRHIQRASTKASYWQEEIKTELIKKILREEKITKSTDKMTTKHNGSRSDDEIQANESDSYNKVPNVQLVFLSVPQLESKKNKKKNMSRKKKKKEEKKKEGDKIIENEKRKEEDKKREQEEKTQEEQNSKEEKLQKDNRIAEEKREEKQKTIEEGRTREEEKKIQKERKQEEQKRTEEEKKQERENRKEKKTIEEEKRLEEKRKEEESKQKEIKRIEQKRRNKEKKKEEEKRIEEEKKQEERKRDEKRMEEESKQEERKSKEEENKLEKEKRKEETRTEKDKKQVEERRREQEKRIEEERRQEERRRIEEEKRRINEKKKEEKRLEEEKRKKKERRQEELKRKEEEIRREEEKIYEERRREEQKKKDEKRLEEEKIRVVEQKIREKIREEENRLEEKIRQEQKIRKEKRKNKIREESENKALRQKIIKEKEIFDQESEKKIENKNKENQKADAIAAMQEVENKSKEAEKKLLNEKLFLMQEQFKKYLKTALQQTHDNKVKTTYKTTQRSTSTTPNFWEQQWQQDQEIKLREEYNKYMELHDADTGLGDKKINYWNDQWRSDLEKKLREKQKHEKTKTTPNIIWFNTEQPTTLYNVEEEGTLKETASMELVSNQPVYVSITDAFGNIMDSQENIQTELSNPFDYNWPRNKLRQTLKGKEKYIPKKIIIRAYPINEPNSFNTRRDEDSDTIYIMPDIRKRDDVIMKRAQDRSRKVTVEQGMSDENTDKKKDVIESEIVIVEGKNDRRKSKRSQSKKVSAVQDKAKERMKKNIYVDKTSETLISDNEELENYKSESGEIKKSHENILQEITDSIRKSEHKKLKRDKFEPEVEYELEEKVLKKKINENIEDENKKIKKNDKEDDTKNYNKVKKKLNDENENSKIILEGNEKYKNNQSEINKGQRKRKLRKKLKAENEDSREIEHKKQKTQHRKGNNKTEKNDENYEDEQDKKQKEPEKEFLKTEHRKVKKDNSQNHDQDQKHKKQEKNVQKSKRKKEVKDKVQMDKTKEEKNTKYTNDQKDVETHNESIEEVTVDKKKEKKRKHKRSRSGKDRENLKIRKNDDKFNEEVIVGKKEEKKGKHKKRTRVKERAKLNLQMEEKEKIKTNKKDEDSDGKEFDFQLMIGEKT